MADREEKKFKFHFIPNTHWDREWLYDFQETRMFLVEFMDKLLDIFNQYPEYKTYLLDSQTVPIEDYLEIRPERKNELIRRIKEKRLFIGPWYTLPEEHLVNGESLVRNLLTGHRVADKYGGIMKVGYSPFSYGQASQMPQIYLGFGIDTILFYHGIVPEEAPSEFIFEGPDGSRLLGSRMGSNARYNFFFAVYRPVVFNKAMLERNYYWNEKGLPFHLSNLSHYMEHHILLDPVKGLDKDQLAKSMEELKETERKHGTTEHIACMQGMDSTQPDVFEMKTMQEAAKILEKDEIFHSSLPEYLDQLKTAVKWDDLVVLKGERRTPRQLGTRVHLYGDVTSARVKIKRENSMAEQELQRKAEPFASAAYLLGIDYPKTYLDLAWKYLLKGHPHDSISGTGVDQIEKDMHYRLDQCRNIAAGVIKRALQSIQLRIDNSDLEDNEVALTVFNPSPYPRNEIVTAVVDLPVDNGFSHYSIHDPDTKKAIEFQETKRYQHPAIVRHLGDATMEMKVWRVHVHILVNDIPALGYRTLLFRVNDSLAGNDRSLIGTVTTLENSYLKVQVNADGTINISDKSTGHIYKGLHYFEDNGEAGHAWRHVPPARDQVITTLNSRPKIEWVESGPLSSCLRITHRMQVPTKLDEGESDYIRRLDGDGDNAGRSAERRELIIQSDLTLTKESHGLAVRTSFINTCEDHRLRVMFPTHIAAACSSAEEPFDVVDRPINRGPDSPWRDTWNPTHPHQRFVDVSDGKTGVALINDGLREYEVSDNADRTIGLTLLRSFEVALATVAWRWERHPEMKGSQGLGEHIFNYMIYPHAGDWDTGGVMKEADRFNLPLEPAQVGAHEGDLPQSHSFVQIEPADILISTLKKAEESENLILRVYNPTGRDLNCRINFYKAPVDSHFVNLNEEAIPEEKPKIEGKVVSFIAKAKKIYTIELSFNL